MPVSKSGTNGESGETADENRLLDNGKNEICSIRAPMMIHINRTFELRAITKDNLKAAKRLIQTIFPASYPDQFYSDLLKAGELVKIAYLKDQAVGIVCCRMETPSPPRGSPSESHRLYIMILGCLPTYRHLKIGTLLLEHVLGLCRTDRITLISLHVQINNDAALAFYRAFGFEIIAKCEQYYKRVEPAAAFLLEKKITPLE